MTKLLERAIFLWKAYANAQLRTLSEEDQDAIASRLLTEMADELQWQAKFASTTDEKWDQMAAMVRQEIMAGDITPLGKMPHIKRGKTVQDLLKFAGTWQGDDMEECLKAVREDRSHSQF